VIVLFGPGGYLELSTSAQPDVTGQYNGRIVATTCASQTDAGLEPDHWAWQDEKYTIVRDDPTPAPETGCAG
jgi:hypothetical protein